MYYKNLCRILTSHSVYYNASWLEVVIVVGTLKNVGGEATVYKLSSRFKASTLCIPFCIIILFVNERNMLIERKVLYCPAHSHRVVPFLLLFLPCNLFYIRYYEPLVAAVGWQ